MRFAVIEGSREWTEPARPAKESPRVLQVEDVQAEARRRLRAIKLDEWRVREFVTALLADPPRDMRAALAQWAEDEGVELA